MRKEDINQGGWNGLTPLHVAAASSSLRMGQWLLHKGAVLECRDDYLRTPLHTAASSGGPDSPDVVAFLIDKGLSVNDSDDGEMTSLHHTVYTYHKVDLDSRDPDISLASLKILLKHKASIEAQDSEGNTVLHLAAWKGHVSIVKFLISQGADINKRDEKGCRPIDLAEDEEIRRLLETRELGFLG